MKYGIISIASTLAAAIVLSGCASPQEKRAKAEEKVAEIYAKADARAAKKRQAEAEEYLEEVPAWVTRPPAPDSQGIYGAGIAESGRLDIAMRRAQLDAMFKVAQQYAQEMTGRERDYTRDSGGRNGVSGDYTRLIESLVQRTPIVGYEVIKSHNVPMNGMYQSFVLVRLPYNSMNSILKEKRAEAVSEESRRAFDDLQRQLSGLQKEKQSQPVAVTELM